jgi:CRISPR-associated protein Cas1
VELLNTLYVTTQGAYLHLESDTVRIDVDRALHGRVPLLRLQNIVIFGNVLVSPALIARCAEDGRAIVLLTERGRFAARIEGPVSGNVLLRRAQHLALSDPERRLPIARAMLAGKLRNTRAVLLRGARDARDAGDRLRLVAAADAQRRSLERLPERESVDFLLGDEGEAARAYFGAFVALIAAGQRDDFGLYERSRRPPRDRMNALLSFLYTLVRVDCAAALEGVGLDPQVGFLHALRPGRPALALDLMEELRPLLADRLALTLVNRRQLLGHHLEETPGGSWLLSDEGRSLLITAYQERKREEVTHPVLERKVPIGLLPHMQARLLARHLRNDLPRYIPFTTSS